jgi:hypothetical protein
VRIEIRIEDGAPIIFLLSEIENDHRVNCYTTKEQHSSATRAYMRSLPKVEKRPDILRAWALLETYARHTRDVMG